MIYRQCPLNYNYLTVTEGRWEGIMGGKGGRVFCNNYEGHMDRTKNGGGWKQGREVWMAGVRGNSGG